MQPLEGIRVLDLSRYPPGRYCSMILGDLGAEVIMIEPPKDAAGVLNILNDDTSPLYIGQNRNKKCVCINIKKPKGKAIFYQLVEKADVIVEGNLPGTLKKLGLDYDSVRKRNKRLIYCSITGYGQYGPYAHRSGHEINFVAAAGMMCPNGCNGYTPRYLQSPSIAGSLGGTTQAVIAILSAIIAREKTKTGQYIDVSITDGALFYHWLDGPEYLLHNALNDPAELPTGIDFAWMNVYRAKDGKYFAIGCAESWRWAKLCSMIGKDDFISLHFAPIEIQKKMYEELKEIFSKKDREVWLKSLEEAEITVSPVHDLEGLFSDPHFIERKSVLQIEHPKLGRIKVLNTPFKLSGTPAKVRTRPPLWAENTKEILHDLLGYSQSELRLLVRSKVIE